MRYLFLGGVYPPQLYRKIFTKAKRGFQSAADTLQKSLIEGLSLHNESINVLTAPWISSFPFGSNILFLKGLNYKQNQRIDSKCISYINLPVIKEFLIAEACSIELLMWSKLDNKKKCVIVYSLQANLLKAAITAKLNDPDIVICLVIPDLPEYMNYNRIYSLLGFKAKAINYIYDNLKYVDYYVLLSQFMIEKLDLDEERCVIMEGIYSKNKSDVITSIVEKEKIILYTGSLNEKYGIDNLLQAFKMIEDKNYRLWICGVGSMKKKVELHQSYDDRIVYYGLLPREEVLVMQKKATVLVNPRLPKGDYTKYSFPSKTMEYLASGTPAVLYKLDGIPAEYFQFCFVPEDLTVEGLKKKIVGVCGMSEYERTRFGMDAVEFIVKYKTPFFQTNKIINLIQGLSKSNTGTL